VGFNQALIAAVYWGYVLQLSPLDAYFGPTVDGQPGKFTVKPAAVLDKRLTAFFQHSGRIDIDKTEPLS
jgi:hypothetical protein